MKKQVKENPMFKNQKKVKVKSNLGSAPEDENEIKSFIIILVVIVVIVGVIYGVTELLKKDEPASDSSNVTEGKIDYTKVSVGTMLNRPYDEYYVLAYDSDTTDAILYSTMMTSYSNKEKGLKIYFLDLNNKLNASYYNKNGDGKSNPKAKNIDELNFGDLTLIKVKKGKITNYIEGYDKIKETLK